ncbi:hypothetical protein SLS62_008559 [Diatrype stigma]|uniref:N-alkane-inducible cytochrome P450 n=1 Tax=Diatrype stigma TaxID=117547 RepID=A0AAN9YN46_9PEZI
MGPLRRKSASPLLGRGIFGEYSTTDNEIWSHQRALIRPSFVRAQVTDFSIFSHHVDQLIALIARHNYEVDLQQLFFRMFIGAYDLRAHQVLDSNSEYMFGESVGLMSENASESATEFHQALDYAQQGTILRLRLGNLMFTHRDKKFRQCCRTVHAYASRFVDQALEYRSKQQQQQQQATGGSQASEKGAAAKEEGTARQKYVFLNELAKDTDDPVLLRDQIVNMLLAARDTTAGLLAFTFFVLARRPDIWSKLRADVLDHYREPLTYEAIQEMTYLRYVLQETLRCFPPIATNSRMAHRDTVVPCGGGPDGRSPLFVKRGSVVTYSTFVMHRRREFFGSDADAFRPERWAPGEGLRPGWEYLPFNGGPRICPGQKFALAEASYTVARLLRAFEAIESRGLDPDEDPVPADGWREQLTLSLTLRDGVLCRLIPAAT